MRSFLRLVFPLLAISMLSVPAAAVSGPAPPAAFAHGVVANLTHYQAWVDISAAYGPWLPWHIKKTFCIHPGTRESWRFDYNPDTAAHYKATEVRIRTEVKLHGCASGTHGTPTRDTYVYRGHEQVNTFLEEHPAGHFYLDMQTF